MVNKDKNETCCYRKFCIVLTPKQNKIGKNILKRCIEKFKKRK